MKKVIIVGDDYGFSKAYNLGAYEAWKNGVVSVLSLMSNMEAAGHAVELLKGDTVDLVLHINFCTGYACSKPESIPSLCDKMGHFYPSSQWKSFDIRDQKCKGEIEPDMEELVAEIKAQIARFEELTGHLPIHMDCHSVCTPAILEALTIVGEELGIHSVSFPEEETPKVKAVHELGNEGDEYIHIINRGTRKDDFLEDRFELMKSPFEMNVMHFHPGYIDRTVIENTSLVLPRAYDQAALCDAEVMEWLEKHAEICTFKDIFK